jgi:hypothetical protein
MRTSRNEEETRWHTSKTRVRNAVRSMTSFRFKYNARGFTWICPTKYDQTLAQKLLIGMRKVVDYGFDDFYENVDSFHVQHNFLHLNLFQELFH